MVKRSLSSDVVVLDVRLEDRAELAGRYLSESPQGGLVLDLVRPMAEGELVELDVRLADGAEHHSIRGVVLWCRQGPGRCPTGIGFLPSETEARERLLAAASGSQAVAAAARREARYQTTMKVTYQSADDFVVDYTRNISAGGLFVSSPRPPRVGAAILFQLYPPGEDEPIDLPGEVAWRRPGQGFGVRFTESGGPGRKRLESLVRQAAVGAPGIGGPPMFEEVSPKIQ